MTTHPTDLVDSLVRGSIDLNCYCGPSLLHIGLSADAAADEAIAAQMGGIVMKDHYYSVTPVTAFLDDSYYRDAPIHLLSGIVLNNSVGGLNSHAVEHSLMLGGRVVWMPTVSSGHHMRRTFRHDDYPTSVPLSRKSSLFVGDARGAITDPVKEILDVVAKHDAVLASGHLHTTETWALLNEAKARGVTRFLYNNPTRVSGVLPEELADFAKLGCYFEHCAIDDEDDLDTLISAGGIERTILGSDPARARASHPAEDMRIIVRRALDIGQPEDAIRQMIGGNARRLLGLN